MKKISLFTLAFLFLASCATMQSFTPSDLKEDGIRYKYGTNKGVKVGDSVAAYKKKANGGSARGGYVHSTPIGSLTVTRVEDDFSIMKKDGEFVIDESISFSRD